MLKNLFKTLFLHSAKRTFLVTGAIVVTLSLPITLFLVQQQQDVRQRAATQDCPCGSRWNSTLKNCVFSSTYYRIDNCGGGTLEPTPTPVPIQPTQIIPTYLSPGGGRDEGESCRIQNDCLNLDGSSSGLACQWAFCGNVSGSAKYCCRAGEQFCPSLGQCSTAAECQQVPGSCLAPTATPTPFGVTPPTRTPTPTFIPVTSSCTSTQITNDSPTYCNCANDVGACEGQKSPNCGQFAYNLCTGGPGGEAVEYRYNCLGVPVAVGGTTAQACITPSPSPTLTPTFTPVPTSTLVPIVATNTPTSTPTNTPTATTAPQQQTDTCPLKERGDANCDGKVNPQDFAIWKGEYLGQQTTKNADFNSDNNVDPQDFVIWKAGYLDPSVPH